MKIIKVLILLIITIIFLYSENNVLEITRLQLTMNRLPQGFNKFRIVHLSDLHNKQYGKSNWILTSLIKIIKPDLIVITGDLINIGYNIESNIQIYMKNIKQIAPVYYVTGNHEASNKSFLNLQKNMEENGIKVLRNSSDKIERNGDAIHIIGIDDPVATGIDENDFSRKFLDRELDEVLNKNDADMFKILLVHRPEHFSLYAEYGIDLIFAGHAHGGQIRLPFIGGLIAPGQGLFPMYTSGRYVIESSIMVVSRGLGNSSFQQRFFNHPEIVVVTLNKSQ